MGQEIEKIWNVVTNLDKADLDAAAACHAIIALMIANHVVTREEATQQIEKSVQKVVTVHQKIREAMEMQHRTSAGRPELRTIQ